MGWHKLAQYFYSHFILNLFNNSFYSCIIMNMKIGIYTNLHKDKDAKASKLLMSILDKKNIKYSISANDDIKGVENQIPLNDLSKDSDIVIAFGGDGTMLNVISYIDDKAIPILGVNMGKIGFLTEIDKTKLESAVDALISGDYTIETRTLVRSQVPSGEKFYALNEAILTSSNSQVSSIKINIDDSYTATVRGDGVMVATPTGSTAYSLACNGPILAPSVKGFIVNTICPHSLHSVPIVVDDGSEIMLSSTSRKMKLVIDGKDRYEFDSDAEVKIRKASFMASFVRLNNQNFYQKLLQKLSFWGE